MGLIDRLRRRPARPEPERWIRVITVANQPEAEMLADMLRQEGILAMVRGRAAGTPEMLAGAPHEVLVPESRALEAHALLDPMEPIQEGDPLTGGENE